MAQTSAQTLRRVLQLLVIGTMVPQVLILAVFSATLPDAFANPPAWTSATVVLVALLTAGGIQAIGFRVPVIEVGTEPDAARDTAAAAFRTSMLVRLGLADAVFFVGLALAVAADRGGAMVLALGTLLSEALLAWFGWPGDRTVQRIQEALERGGSPSYLREALESPPPAPRGR